MRPDSIKVRIRTISFKRPRVFVPVKPNLWLSGLLVLLQDSDGAKVLCYIGFSDVGGQALDAVRIGPGGAKLRDVPSYLHMMPNVGPLHTLDGYGEACKII
jgi:hypothetical protein